MDRDTLEILIRAIEGEDDSDALRGLRGLQNFFKDEGVPLSEALRFSVGALASLRARGPQVIDGSVGGDSQAVSVSTPMPALNGMPDCRCTGQGFLEIFMPGATGGERVTLPEGAATHAKDIALHLKDALVASVINKSRFKLKLADIKNGRGEVIETVLQAEYDRDGMTPIRVWMGVRGEVAALATVLRKAVANCAPDLVAA